MAHARDRARDEARAADERVERVRQEDEEELERTRQEVDSAHRDLLNAQRQLDRSERKLEKAERQLDHAERKLDGTQRKLDSTQRKLDSTQRKLDGTQRKLESALGRLRKSERDREREREHRLTAERKLAATERRAERLERSLAALRSGRGYKLMRTLWRLRRPFARAPRGAGGDSASDDDGPTPRGEERDPEPYPAPRTPGAAAAQTDPPATAPPLARVEPGRADPGRRPRTGRLRVAAVLDEMSAACFAPECELVPLALEGWREQLDEHEPDLLLVESAWQGNGGKWQYRIAKYARKDLAGLPALRALVDDCRRRGIPTAFWNKEDPIHFERFAEAAALFDHVFTTDERCIDRYRALPGERTVTALPFAAQPRIHNPTAIVDERSASPCFAGAWYRDRHVDRQTALEAVLDAARPFGLVIYDRTFGTSDAAFGFPDRFRPHVLGKLPYDRILEVYKSHRVFLNANSVVDSPTMCSRRVLELAASDTPILSTPSAALHELVGDAVLEASDEPTATDALELLLGNAGERRRRTRAARRAVMSRHTYEHRLAAIAEVAGLGDRIDQGPAIAALAIADGADAARRLARALAAQDAAPDELVIGTQAEAAIDVGGLERLLPATRVRTARLDGATVGSRAGANGGGADAPAGALKALAAATDAPWVLPMPAAASLRPHVVSDMRAALRFVDADAIGTAPAAGGQAPIEHRETDAVDPRATLARRELVEARGWPAADGGEDPPAMAGWSDDGVRMYAADSDWIDA